MLPKEHGYFLKGIKSACLQIRDGVFGTTLSKAAKDYPEVEKLVKDIKYQEIKTHRVPKNWKPRSHAKINEAS